MTKWTVTGTFVVVEAHTESESVDDTQETSGEQPGGRAVAAEARYARAPPERDPAGRRVPPRVLPEDYTPEPVAREACSSITEWVKDGYRPVLTVRMEDGSEHLVDLGRTP